MNFPIDKPRGRMGPEKLRSDLRALRERSRQNLPTIEQTAQNLWKHNLRRSEEGSLMKLLHSLKSHPAMATLLGIAVVAAVLLAVPISYTKTTGYRATLEISNADGIDIDAVAAEFGKAFDAENVAVRAGAAGASISADIPVTSPAKLKGIAGGFAQALTQRGVTANARVEPVTERVTGNVYAMAADGIIEIRVNSEGLTDEEIAEEIREKIEAAGLEAILVDVETGDGEKRIEIGIGRQAEAGSAPRPVKIVLDGMEPPPGGECCTTQRAIELRISTEGKTLEEARAEALEQLQALGFTDLADIDIEDCGDYYRVTVGQIPDGSLDGGAGALLGEPRSESKTLGEIKADFTK